MLRKVMFPFEFANPAHAIAYITLPGFVCMVISLMLWAYAWHLQQQTIETFNAATVELTQLQHKNRLVIAHPQVVISQVQPKQRLSPAQQKELKKIADQITTPWFELLSCLEMAQDQSVALLQVSPDAGKHTISVAGETRDYAALLAYVYRLQQDPALREAHLIQHQVNATHPQHPVHFELQGTWHVE